MSNTKQPIRVKIMKCSDGTYWYRNEIGNEFTVDYSIQDMYRVFTNGKSLSVLKKDVEIIHETKQPPVELVEKFTLITSVNHPTNVQIYKSVQQCAQIAVDYAEPFKEQFIKWLNLYNQKEEENRELRENLANLVSTVDAGYMSHYEDGFEQWEKQLEEDILKAKQLLNKNEDGK